MKNRRRSIDWNTPPRGWSYQARSSPLHPFLRPVLHVSRPDAELRRVGDPRFPQLSRSIVDLANDDPSLCWSTSFIEDRDIFLLRE